MVFQSWNSNASVPSWTLENDGPVMLLCEYPNRKLITDCGNNVRSKSLIRRRVAKRCGEEVTGMLGLDVGGLSGFARRL